MGVMVMTLYFSLIAAVAVAMPEEYGPRMKPTPSSVMSFSVRRAEVCGLLSSS